jgi:hypothetical protein
MRKNPKGAAEPDQNSVAIVALLSFIVSSRPESSRTPARVVADKKHYAESQND